MNNAASLLYDYYHLENASAQAGRPIPKMEYVIPSRADAATHEKSKFAAYFAKVQALAVDQDLWIDGAEPPNLFALRWAAAFIQQLENDDFLPTGVVASAEGGIGIYFIDGNKYADLECLNDW